MHTVIQQIVDWMILVMASILLLFTAALVLFHLLANARQKSVQRIRRQILCLISPEAHIEYLKSCIRGLLESGGEVSLRSVRGVRSQRGVQVLELLSREVSGEEARRLREAVEEPWFAAYMARRLAGRHKDAALLVTKLLAQLRLPGCTSQILENLRRWPKDADAQQIGLLALFMRGEREELAALFSDSSFRLCLSFRTLQELFHCYGGDRAALYGRLLSCECDQYVRRACVRGIGLDGCTALCGQLLPGLTDPGLNLRLETVRTLGRLHYAPAAETIAAMTRSSEWEMRCAAVDALAQIAGPACYDAVLECMFDKEWWVRFHAAEALAALPCRERLEADVRDRGDRYAGEMLRFMVERGEILKGGSAA